MGKKCFVPRCKPGYKTCTEKLSLFAAPREAHHLKISRHAIPRMDCVLQSTDYVCEKHCEPRQLTVTYVTIFHAALLSTYRFGFLSAVWNQLGCPAPDKMPYCCVPRCKSSSKQRTPGISFHEIPSDPELRAKWLKVISRDDWTPNTTSCYSTVCCRHFGSFDFKEGCKIRKLKKDAVPSIFEEYPAYLQPPKNRERSDASVRKREAAAPVNTPPPKRRAVESQLESPSLPLNDLPSVDVASQELSLMDCSATELPLPLENGASERCITTTVQVDRAVQCRHYSRFRQWTKWRPAMKLLQEQAGHTCDASFAGVGPTVQFMDTVHRWFVLMDVSHCTQHIHQKNADCKQFESAGDERLIWLETSFLDYLADLNSHAQQRHQEKLSFEGQQLPDPLDDDIVQFSVSASPRTFPPVTAADIFVYLVEGVCFYTKEQFKNHKLSDAYNAFLSGKVKRVMSFKAGKRGLGVVILTASVEASQLLSKTY
ncbi:hypothetical protein HPB49_007399 [Dermacentor silvarum]|uniref:Uncharacterized protein n=1 Tax=Dermacentor silvarum TaxID=543639 RepID=A0ACB8CDS1_DERSI|nr:hypothetical protein HPB49_007399 [Dermacentor silvarum]